MNKPADYSYPAILADLKAKHAGEDYNRLAAAASYLYQSRLATVDRFGRVEYHEDARAIAPRCFPTPQVGSVDAETLQRFLDSRVATPSELAPPPRRAPTAVEQRLLDAENNAASAAAAVETYESAYQEALAASGGHDRAAARAAAREAVEAMRR